MIEIQSLNYLCRVIVITCLIKLAPKKYQNICVKWLFIHWEVSIDKTRSKRIWCLGPKYQIKIEIKRIEYIGYLAVGWMTQRFHFWCVVVHIGAVSKWQLIFSDIKLNIYMANVNPKSRCNCVVCFEIVRWL